MENPFTVKQVMIFIHMVIFPIPEVTNTNFPDGSVFVGLFLLKYKTSCYHCDDQFHASPVDSVNLKLILKSLFFFFLHDLEGFLKNSTADRLPGLYM